MSELFSQLGVDWKLLLAQAVNFGIVLAVLTFFLYRPLLKILRERREKIASGVKASEEGERRLKEIDATRDYTLADAAKQGSLVVAQAETRAVSRGREIISGAQGKAAALLREAELRASRERSEERDAFLSEAKSLLRSALSAAVAAHPDEVDEKLISEAEHTLKKSLAPTPNGA